MNIVVVGSCTLEQRVKPHSHEVGAKILVDRVHLADDDSILGDQLVQDVECSHSRLVAGAQHQRHLAHCLSMEALRALQPQVILSSAPWVGLRS